MSDLRAIGRNSPPQVRPGQAPSVAGVAQTILQMAAPQGCDLIILGDSAYSPFVELFVHSTVDHVLREGGYSVLVCS